MIIVISMTQRNISKRNEFQQEKKGRSKYKKTKSYQLHLIIYMLTDNLTGCFSEKKLDQY